MCDIRPQVGPGEQRYSYSDPGPTLDQPWTGEEFDAALETLAGTGEFEYALDLGMAWTGEWYPYAFGPFLQSHGGDILDVSTNMADSALNGETGMAFGEWW